MEATKHFTDLTKPEQESTNAFDLREMAHYYGGWDNLIGIINGLKEIDNEAAFERMQEDYDHKSEYERQEEQHLIQRDLK